MAGGTSTASGAGASLFSEPAGAAGVATVSGASAGPGAGAAAGVSTDAFLSAGQSVGAAVGVSANGSLSAGQSIGSAAGLSNVSAKTPATLDATPSVDRGIVIEQIGAGATRVVVPDTYLNPFNIGVACEADGTVNYTLEHTFEDVFSPSFDASSATWFANSGLSAKTTSAVGNYAYPVNGIRLRVASGPGTVRAYIAQAGTR